MGLRPINALADITNYVMMDRNRPLHAYDADRLTGAIGARMGRAGERFEALNGQTYEVAETDCVIADEAGVLGLGGIIGGMTSGCTAETTTVFLKSALFDRSRIARTGRRTSASTPMRATASSAASTPSSPYRGSNSLPASSSRSAAARRARSRLAARSPKRLGSSSYRRAR